MRKNKFVLGLFIAALMLVGVTSLFLIDTSAQQMRIIALTQGWNLVTWTGEKQSASEALDSVSDAVSAVYGYDNDSQTFTRYFIDRPEISTLTDFGSEEAYWVLAQRPVDWSVPGPAAASCPPSTPCPLSTPCPSCGDWQSVAEECAVDYGQCIGALAECASNFGACVAALDCWRACHLDLGSCWFDCHLALGSCWVDCNFSLRLCVQYASDLAAAKACVGIWDCSYCNEIWDCLYCNEIWDCIYCDEALGG